MAQTVTASSKKIKATMALRGLTMHMIADAIGVTHGGVSRTIAGNRRNPRLRAKISVLLGIPLDVWRELDTELKVQEVRQS
jgi:transcriptional regulator with XRE-family HTH domain